MIVIHIESICLPVSCIKHKIYETTILFVLLFGGRRSVTFREKHRFMVSENRMLRKIFGPKREETT
jgi:hypothetical protein